MYIQQVSGGISSQVSVVEYMQHTQTQERLQCRHHVHDRY